MRPVLIVLSDDLGRGVPGVSDDPDIADQLLSATLDLARRVGGVGRVLLFSPPEDEVRLTRRALGFRLWPAEGGSPGLRFANAFRQASELGYEGALVLGLRFPTFPADQLTKAAAMLEEHQGVLASDGDGGVAVLGLQRHEPTLFPDVPEVPDLDTLTRRARQQLVRLVDLEPCRGLDAQTVGPYLATRGS